ncbi:DTW domain-containing protein [Microbulbifer harenosus]|uniref:tRNA-uridine aminocarboxypropyltransferase n=1 Tax=Microbulbifer harenosus TaxID=2576840 RepID=A0ABY2UM76_9GAMM|nr:DTW domain-containing protein [Microbulbifer harenosus]
MWRESCRPECVQIILLTHEREVMRPSNTGQLVLTAVSDVGVSAKRLIWRRAEPDKTLLSMLGGGSTGLVYPDTEVAGAAYSTLDIEACQRFILLDATWQEARKMYNRSPYLHAVGRVSLNSARGSRYRLRRNQKKEGLCTAECVVEILRNKDRHELADRLEEQFVHFNENGG